MLPHDDTATCIRNLGIGRLRFCYTDVGLLTAATQIHPVGAWDACSKRSNRETPSTLAPTCCTTSSDGAGIRYNVWNSTSGATGGRTIPARSLVQRYCTKLSNACGSPSGCTHAQPRWSGSCSFHKSIACGIMMRCCMSRVSGHP